MTTAELPEGFRVGLLAAAVCIAGYAVMTAGTQDDPYAPNDWLFSHTYLAQLALDQERIPLNRELLTSHGFAESVGAFQEETGLDRMTFYANTIWHFWNGLPLQPALLATLSALTGLEPEELSRVPVGGIAVLLLLAASADLLLERTARPHLAWLAPFVAILCSAPLMLDVRVMMPSTSLVVLALLLHLLLRRTLRADTWALAYAMLPLALLPFWYYTVSYFVMLLFAGFLVANIAMRVHRSDAPQVVPLAVAALVPLALAGVLALNGALTSHVEMARSLGGSLPLLGSETASSNYDDHLNRQAWRSALLYVELTLLFAPLALVSLGATWRLLRRRTIEPQPAVFAQWAVGGALFTAVMQSTVGVSFLNRSVIYLSALAALAFAWSAAHARRSRAVGIAVALALAFGVVATPVLVATATPRYTAGDAMAFAWAEERIPASDVLYGSLDASSVLLRAHGFSQALAFHPRTQLLEDFWYGNDTGALVPYLASVEWFVLRDDAASVGFEEFGPLREPISQDAYAKFGRSPDLHRVFDNGEVEVFQVHLETTRTRDLGRPGPVHSPSDSD